jgi:hypothetical protein
MIQILASVQVLIGILLVIAIGSLVQFLQGKAEIPHLPPGWQILRPPSLSPGQGSVPGNQRPDQI